MGAGTTQSTGKQTRRRRSRRQAAAMSEINVTPFVDVMLVLLIIFMVAAPLVQSGVSVELPETAAAALPQNEQQDEPLTVTLKADGQVLLMSNEEPVENIISSLRAIAAQRTDNQIYLRADGSVPYERVAQLMGALNAGGFNKINFVTEQGGPSFDGSDG